MYSDLILASASPQRKKLLYQIGIKARIEPSQIDEDIDMGLMLPEEWVCKIALAKAKAVASRLMQGLILGVDTIVVLQGEILGKPNTEEKAKEMLKKLRGTTQQVITGLALLDAKTGRNMTDKVITDVTMKNISDAQIAGYVVTGEPLNKAGGLAIEGLGAKFITNISGCYFNVVGLPLARLVDMLAEFNYKLDEETEGMDNRRRSDILAEAREFF